ncbi:MAG: hypothetical protein FWB86_14710 [Treponema sp.]|nr:hypothetical protein [Treponema sp.]
MSDIKLVYEWLKYSQNELSVDDAIAKSAISKAQSIYDFCIRKILDF